MQNTVAAHRAIISCSYQLKVIFIKTSRYKLLNNIKFMNIEQHKNN